MSLRSPIARARGLGSAKTGTHHWWLQRLTALALIPLTLWFVPSIVAYGAADYEAVIAWVRTPWVSVALILLIVTVLYHAQLGLQVVLEDYVAPAWLRIASVVAVKFAVWILAALSGLGVVRVAIGG
jgi:succinate dehydrogenase / fumarate reductase membrane anchor subunit